MKVQNCRKSYIYPMEDHLLSLAPPYKLNREWAIFLATFLGGPLPGAFLMAENFRNLGQPEKAKWTWAVAVVLILFLLLLGYIPVLNQIPGYLYTIISLVIARFFSRKFQSAAIKQHIDDGGVLYPVGRALLAALVGIVIVVGISVGCYYWASRSV
ncbi:MAG TPA: hypothetical protein VL547_15500 [Dinghuibacter sp.]|uniref:hypothetical protein n=1 Tax=Dinghuibacter sp. TaxID=2024697 RepID=UPI002B73A8D4|nr:hypothetical protein [Dinghuibacter sp.]HTJ13439.1 hypothetical protein [Dinghuibacter sp.]